MPAYSRILLKLSGEAFLDDNSFGFSNSAIQKITLEIESLTTQKIQIAIVIGGGNIFRGRNREELSLNRVPADQIGMLATIINGMLLKEFLANKNIDASVLSAVSCGNFVESYTQRKAIKLLGKGSIVIFTGGTSNPYFTTDTAAALRAAEIDAELLIKATNVDGIFDTDPNQNEDALQLKKLTYSQVIEKQLKIMDLSAIDVCMQKKIPISVVNIKKPKSLIEAVVHGKMGTLVTGA